MEVLKLKQLVLFAFLIILKLSTIQLCPIYLTISPNGKTLQESFLEINWGPNCIEKPEWISVYREDPSISYANSEFTIQNITSSSGKFLTNIRIGEINFPGGWNRDDNDSKKLVSYAKGKCLSFYVAGYVDKEILNMDCLKIQPNWMGFSENIARVPLKYLFIPGTHSSGAYDDNRLKHQSALVKNYGCSQNLDVWSQLVFGIRFLDLRIGYRNLSDNFWIVNENIMIAELEPILYDIKRFAKNSGEVVILDFSAFPIGFNKRSSRHSKLLEILMKEFGDIAVKRSETRVKNAYDLTLNEIRNAGKNLIITYPMESLSCLDRECDIIWPHWKRFSIKNMNDSEILDFMRILFSQKDLTYTENKGWIFEATRGLEQSFNLQNFLEPSRNRAYELNSKISNYLGGPWSLATNVVTLDYFSTTNIVDIAIYANTNKAFTFVNSDLTNFDILN